jgi:hypothetical protein
MKLRLFNLSIRISKWVVIFIFVLAYWSGAVSVMQTVIYSDVNILSHINASYDFKMRELWGGYYDYIKFVKENTPSNASIIVPPQMFPWPSIGNVGLDRYFLFPRNLVNGSLNGPIDISSCNYVMLVWGEGGSDKNTYGWPKVPIKAEKVIYFDPATHTIVEHLGNFDSKMVSASNAWGLIKINK